MYMQVYLSNLAWCPEIRIDLHIYSVVLIPVIHILSSSEKEYSKKFCLIDLSKETCIL